MHKLNALIILQVVLLLGKVLFVCGIEISVNLKPKQVRCIRERINKNTLVVGKFKSDDKKNVFSVYVYDEDTSETNFVSKNTKNPIFESLNDHDTKTAFTTFYASSYSFCVFNSNTPKIINVHFEIKYGSEAKDYAKIAKTEHLNVATVHIKQIIDQMNNFHNNLIRMKIMEENEKKNGDKLNDSLMWFALITIVIIIITAVIQDFYFKKFFTSKKII